MNWQDYFGGYYVSCEEERGLKGDSGWVSDKDREAWSCDKAEGESWFGWRGSGACPFAPEPKSTEKPKQWALEQ